MGHKVHAAKLAFVGWEHAENYQSRGDKTGRREMALSYGGVHTKQSPR